MWKVKLPRPNMPVLIPKLKVAWIISKVHLMNFDKAFHMQGIAKPIQEETIDEHVLWTRCEGHNGIYNRAPLCTKFAI